MLKLPKKPKQSASILVKEKYLKKVTEIKKQNQERKRLNDYAKRLDAQISGIGSSHVLPNRFSVAKVSRRPKKGSGKKRVAKKRSGRRRKR